MIRAAIYCRLSEEDRDKLHPEAESRSIQNQKAMLTQHAREQGWEICGIYSDEDYAGSDRRRPAFNRLLRDAEAGKIDVILCKSQSRFTREMELVEKYIHGLFPLWGVRFVGLADHADTENSGNKKARQINGLINEWYLEDLSENIRSVLTSRRKQGLHIGASALYGYRKDPAQRGHLLIDEEAAAVVREIFLLYSRGYGKTEIARLLTARGIPTPAAYKQHRTDGAPWRYAGISGILHNEMYIGNMVQGKYGSVSYKLRQNKPRPRADWYIVPHTHEPIIDNALWQRVQSMLNANSRPFHDGKIGLFSGKARCAACGAVLRSTKTGDSAYLQCPRHLADHSACTGAFISTARLEQELRQEWQRISRDADAEIPPLTREMVEFLLDYVCVGKRIAGCRDVPLEIHWNF